MKKLHVALLFAAVGLVASIRAVPKPIPKQAGLISTQTRLVRLLVVVFDNTGARATGLTSGDFRVLDNGSEQQITYFSHLRVPVSVVLAADESGSMGYKIPFVREALDTLLDPFPNPEAQKKFPDEFALVRFADQAEQATRFMTGAELEPWIGRLVEPTDDNTALFDAIYLSTAVADKGTNKRRAIILVTDGGDNHSRYSLKQTRRFLEETEVPVFAIMAKPSFTFLGLFRSRPKQQQPPMTGSPVPQSKQSVIIVRRRKDVITAAERRGPHNMKVVAEASGGAVFTARRLRDLPRIVRSIGLAIRYAYLIGYVPPARVESVSGSSNRSDADWHRVKVRLVPASRYKGYAVYAKDGYFGDQIP